jgi:hypothetical protein
MSVSAQTESIGPLGEEWDPEGGFSRKTVVPLGGWVGCPQQGPTGVRDITLTVALPHDVLGGAPLANS